MDRGLLRSSVSSIIPQCEKVIYIKYSFKRAFSFLNEYAFLDFILLSIVITVGVIYDHAQCIMERY